MRYLSAFFLTSLLYIALGVAFLFALPNDVLKIKKEEKKRVSLNYVKIIKPKKIELKNKIKKEIVKAKPKEKILEINKTIKKVAKKTIKLKSKKTYKKRKKKIEKIAEKKVFTKLIKKEVKTTKVLKKQKQELLTQSTKKQITKKIRPQSVDYRESFLKENLFAIKKHIQKHVRYSKRARKMNIQGEVLVQFCITKEGRIKNIQALSGHKLLRKSTIKAISSASVYFPKVQKDLIIKVPISYKLI